MNAPGSHAGDGAMLSRLIGVGRRCGLTPETVLLHVLDGVPLAEVHAAAATRHPGEATLSAAPSTQIALDERTIAVCLAPAEKKEKIANLYGQTALRNPAIAHLVDSTPGAVSWFLRQARESGDPRVLAGDRNRGVGIGEADTDEAPETLPCLAEAHTDLIKAQIAETTAKLALLRDEPAPAPAEDDSDGLVFRQPECDAGASPDEQERIDLLNEQISRTAAMLADARETPPAEAVTQPHPAAPIVPDEAQAAPAADPAAPGERIARAPAPSNKAPQPGTKAHQALELWATTDLDYVAIGARIQSTAATVYERIRQGKKRRDPRWQQGFTRRKQVPNPQPEAGQANAGGGHDVAQHQEQDATVGAAGEPREGVEPVAPENSAETANEAPMAVDGDGVAVATAPPSQSIDIPPAGDGEPRRGRAEPDVSPEGATEVASSIQGTPPAPDRAVSPAPPPFDPVEKGTVRRESDSAVRPARPGSGQDGLATLPELAEDVVCAVNAGVIVGPLGTLTGFPLINAVLQVLASGVLLDSSVVATRAGVRSGPAVLALLRQWTGDLEKVGIDVVRFEPADVRIKRARP